MSVGHGCVKFLSMFLPVSLSVSVSVPVSLSLSEFLSLSAEISPDKYEYLYLTCYSNYLVNSHGPEEVVRKFKGLSHERGRIKSAEILGSARQIYGSILLQMA